tara:strand:+ start:409 stop:696 length:288 start_codon:yes stop_codon:yes gene_type:complete
MESTIKISNNVKKDAQIIDSIIKKLSLKNKLNNKEINYIINLMKIYSLKSNFSKTRQTEKDISNVLFEKGISNSLQMSNDYYKQKLKKIIKSRKS